MNSRTTPCDAAEYTRSLERLAARFARHRLCMSYNDSYFGEPVGELKCIAVELNRLLPSAVFDEDAPSGLPIVATGKQVPVDAIVNWISVDDELPQVETDVLVRGKRGDTVCHDVAGLFFGVWQSQSSEKRTGFAVTHWMSIPAIAVVSALEKKPAPAHKASCALTGEAETCPCQTSTTAVSAH